MPAASNTQPQAMTQGVQLNPTMHTLQRGSHQTRVIPSGLPWKTLSCFTPEASAQVGTVGQWGWLAHIFISENLAGPRASLVFEMRCLGEKKGSCLPAPPTGCRNDSQLNANITRLRSLEMACSDSERGAAGEGRASAESTPSLHTKKSSCVTILLSATQKLHTLGKIISPGLRAR